MISPWTFYAKQKQQSSEITQKQTIFQEQIKKKKSNKKKNKSNQKFLQNKAIPNQFMEIQQNNKFNSINTQIENQNLINFRQINNINKYVEQSTKKSQKTKSPQFTNNEKKFMNLIENVEAKYLSYKGYSNNITPYVEPPVYFDLSLSKVNKQPCSNLFGQALIYEQKKKQFKKLDFLIILRTIKQALKVQKYMQLINQNDSYGNNQINSVVKGHEEHLIKLLQKNNKNYMIKQKNMNLLLGETQMNTINDDGLKQIDDILPPINYLHDSIESHEMISRQLKLKHHINLIRLGPSNNELRTNRSPKNISKSNLFELMQKMTVNTKNKNKSKIRIKQKNQKIRKQNNQIQKTQLQKESADVKSSQFTDKNMNLSSKTHNVVQYPSTVRRLREKTIETNHQTKPIINQAIKHQKQDFSLQKLYKSRQPKSLKKSKLTIIDSKNHLKSQQSQQIQENTKNIQNSNNYIKRMDRINSNFIQNQDKWKININVVQKRSRN